MCEQGNGWHIQCMVQAKAKALAEEERELSQLRTRLAAKERTWHESAAEHASTAATAQVRHAPVVLRDLRAITRA